MDVGSDTRKGPSAESTDDPGIPSKADGDDIGHANEDPKADAPEGSTSSPIETTVKEPGSSLLGNVMTGESQPSQDSRLWTWGKWAYAYVPAIRRSATEVSRAVDTETTDPEPPSEHAALPDLEQPEETAIHEAIGAIPPSDTKQSIYNSAPAGASLGTETEQGIGVDPEHLSEVPFFTDNRTIADNKATWSLTGLAASAWNWRKGAENVSAVTPASEDIPIPTGLPLEGVSVSTAESETIPAQVDSPSIAAQDSKAAGTVQSATSDLDTTALGSTEDASPSQKAEDTSNLSRSAWAFAAASRWVPRRASGMNKDKAAALEPSLDGPSHQSETPAAVDQTAAGPGVQEPTPITTAAADQTRHQSEINPSTAVQSIALTPEVLEARPSPLLPSSASMVATTRPNLVLPSFNHTFRRPPRGHPEQSRPKSSVANDTDKNSSVDMPSPGAPSRPVSPPSMAWRALGAVSQYARGGSRDSSLPPKSNNMNDRPVIDVEKSPLPILTSSGKDQWKGVRRIVIIGVHGWFPNAHVQK